MKVAAAQAIAKLAREDVPDEVVALMGEIGLIMEKITLYLQLLILG